MLHILKCQQCAAYTLKEQCKCGGQAISPKPPKWSPDDKYGSYRRTVKRKVLEEKGLL